MTYKKQRFLILVGIGLFAIGLGMVYIPLALIFLGAVVLIEVLTCTPPGSEK